MIVKCCIFYFIRLTDSPNIFQKSKTMSERRRSKNQTVSLCDEILHPVHPHIHQAPVRPIRHQDQSHGDFVFLFSNKIRTSVVYVNRT